MKICLEFKGSDLLCPKPPVRICFAQYFSQDLQNKTTTMFWVINCYPQKFPRNTLWSNTFPKLADFFPAMLCFGSSTTIQPLMQNHWKFMLDFIGKVRTKNSPPFHLENSFVKTQFPIQKPSFSSLTCMLSLTRLTSLNNTTSLTRFTNPH